MTGQSEKNAPALTRGNILAALVTFALPVLLALFLQAMYGAADLIIVGRFAGTAFVRRRTAGRAVHC